jgi:hypothetical protein
LKNVSDHFDFADTLNDVPQMFATQQGRNRVDAGEITAIASSIA